MKVNAFLDWNIISRLHLKLLFDEILKIVNLLYVCITAKYLTIRCKNNRYWWKYDTFLSRNIHFESILSTKRYSLLLDFCWKVSSMLPTVLLSTAMCLSILSLGSFINQMILVVIKARSLLIEKLCILLAWNLWWKWRIIILNYVFCIGFKILQNNSCMSQIYKNRLCLLYKIWNYCTYSHPFL